MKKNSSYSKKKITEYRPETFAKLKYFLNGPKSTSRSIYNIILNSMVSIYESSRDIRDTVVGTRNKFDLATMFSDAELEQQRKTVFETPILISVIVPVFNTNKTYLKEMIESVTSQTYGGWELCLADGSDSQHQYVGQICEEYSARDSRIKYMKLDENRGISENTNAAIRMSRGDYLALLDHDDMLHPAALYEVMKAICEGNADFIYTDECIFKGNLNHLRALHFKPDFAPDNLLGNNYICHLSVFSREILNAVGGFRSEYDGSQDHDFILRATNAAKCIAHIPEVLYFWRSHPGSTSYNVDSKSYATVAGCKAVRDNLGEKGVAATVESTEKGPTFYRIDYELTSHPKVSIIIPNYEHLDVLKNCIDSIISKTTYNNYEILIVENNSKSSEIFDYYKKIQSEHADINVVTWNGTFNFSQICNYGAEHAAGSVLLFLNNDIEVITPNWIEEMLMYAQREDVGAVGAKLYYPDDTIQHAGILFGLGGIAGHWFSRSPREDTGYMGRLIHAQDVTAVTGACIMMRKSVFEEVGGFTPEYAVAFNDVDLCLKLRKKGYLNVWTPFAELYHYESLSRGLEDTPEKIIRFKRECGLLNRDWKKEMEYGDPYYNPNFSMEKTPFTCKNKSEKYKARYVHRNK